MCCFQMAPNSLLRSAWQGTCLEGEKTKKALGVLNSQGPWMGRKEETWQKGLETGRGADRSWPIEVIHPGQS